MTKKLRIHEFAERLGVSTYTIRRWEREGRFVAKRLPSGQRYFVESDVRKVLGIQPDKRSTVVYCRVSSAGQKKDLQSQKEAMEQFCLGAGIEVDEWITEIGGGMNFKRRKFLEIMDRMARGEIEHVVLAHKDRLMRFGFDLFEHIAHENDCRVTIANQETLSPQREMVEDLLAIVHTFSCRLYGLRKYRKEIKTDYPEAKLKSEEPLS